MLLPFTNAVVPTIDLAGGRVVIELPQEMTATIRRGRNCATAIVARAWMPNGSR